MTDRYDQLVRAVTLILLTSRDIPPAAAKILAEHGIACNPFPENYESSIRRTLDKYENPQPMRDADFVKMARLDVHVLCQETLALVRVVKAIYSWRIGTLSEDSLDRELNDLLTWLARSREAHI